MTGEFSGEKFGHKAVDCTRTSESTNACAPLKCPFVDMVVGKMSVSTLIDTGSSVNLLQITVFNQLNCHILEETSRVFEGIGGSSVRPVGKFPTNIMVQNNIFAVVFFVLKDADMNVRALLGNDFLSQTSFIFEKSQMRIMKSGDSANMMTTTAETTNEFLLTLSLVADDWFEHQIDKIFALTNSEVEDRIAKLVRSYSPEGCLSSPVQMHITMLDDAPVFDHPRRLPYADKAIVERQVADWLDEGIIRPSTSTYASAVVLVSKKDGTKRLCCDYRRLSVAAY